MKLRVQVIRKIANKQKIYTTINMAKNISSLRRKCKVRSLTKWEYRTYAYANVAP